MLTKVLIAIAAIVVVFAVVVALQPSSFQVARNIRNFRSSGGGICPGE